MKTIYTSRLYNKCGYRPIIVWVLFCDVLHGENKNVLCYLARYEPNMLINKGNVYTVQYVDTQYRIICQVKSNGFTMVPPDEFISLLQIHENTEKQLYRICELFTKKSQSHFKCSHQLKIDMQPDIFIYKIRRKPLISINAGRFTCSVLLLELWERISSQNPF